MPSATLTTTTAPTSTITLTDPGSRSLRQCYIKALYGMNVLSSGSSPDHGAEKPDPGPARCLRRARRPRRHRDQASQQDAAHLCATGTPGNTPIISLVAKSVSLVTPGETKEDTKSRNSIQDKSHFRLQERSHKTGGDGHDAAEVVRVDGPLPQGKTIDENHNITDGGHGAADIQNLHTVINKGEDFFRSGGLSMVDTDSLYSRLFADTKVKEKNVVPNAVTPFPSPSRGFSANGAALTQSYVTAGNSPQPSPSQEVSVTGERDETTLESEATDTTSEQLSSKTANSKTLPETPRRVGKVPGDSVSKPPQTSTNEGSRPRFSFNAIATPKRAVQRCNIALSSTPAPTATNTSDVDCFNTAHTSTVQTTPPSALRSAPPLVSQAFCATLSTPVGQAPRVYARVHPPPGSRRVVSTSDIGDQCTRGQAAKYAASQRKRGRLSTSCLSQLSQSIVAGAEVDTRVVNARWSRWVKSRQGTSDKAACGDVNTDRDAFGDVFSPDRSNSVRNVRGIKGLTPARSASKDRTMRSKTGSMSSACRKELTFTNKSIRCSGKIRQTDSDGSSLIGQTPETARPTHCPEKTGKLTDSSSTSSESLTTKHRNRSDQGVPSEKLKTSRPETVGADTSAGQPRYTGADASRTPRSSDTTAVSMATRKRSPSQAGLILTSAGYKLMPSEGEEKAAKKDKPSRKRKFSVTSRAMTDPSSVPNCPTTKQERGDSCKKAKLSASDSKLYGSVSNCISSSVNGRIIEPVATKQDYFMAYHSLKRKSDFKMRSAPRVKSTAENQSLIISGVKLKSSLTKRWALDTTPTSTKESHWAIYAGTKPKSSMANRWLSGNSKAEAVPFPAADETGDCHVKNSGK